MRSNGFRIGAGLTCFEDFGEAALVNGKAQVKLDPQFASCEGQPRLFESLGDCNGLYVSARSTMAFSVREQKRGAQNWLFLSDRSRPGLLLPEKSWLSKDQQSLMIRQH
jgi:hypothetical protein